MAHRPFVSYPDPRLRAVAAAVDAVTVQVCTIWDEMLEAMYAMPGVGLAAPQLGIGLRLAVLDASDTRDRPVRLANPQVVAASAQTRTQREASPNLPGISADVIRPAQVEVRFLDETGSEQTRSFTGLWATSVQHQIDHLNGKVFVDRLGAVKRQRLLASYRKQTRNRARRGA